ncbi:unnamed protein product [Lampetra fluviatilis]
MVAAVAAAGAAGLADDWGQGHREVTQQLAAKLGSPFLTIEPRGGRRRTEVVQLLALLLLPLGLLLQLELLLLLLLLELLLLLLLLKLLLQKLLLLQLELLRQIVPPPNCLPH